MATPGSNLFRRAAKLIKLQEVQYYPFATRTLNAARQWVPAFGTPYPLAASVQAVPRNSYAELGLDFNSGVSPGKFSQPNAASSHVSMQYSLPEDGRLSTQQVADRPRHEPSSTTTRDREARKAM